MTDNLFVHGSKRDWLAEKCGWERFADCGHWTPPGADECWGTAFAFENSDTLVAECGALMEEKHWVVDCSHFPRGVHGEWWQGDERRYFEAETLNDALVDMFYDALGGPKEDTQ